MKQSDEITGVVVGKTNPATKDICRLLAQKGISTVVVPKEVTLPDSNEPDSVFDQVHWSGQPGKDLFFNGWKLMF